MNSRTILSGIALVAVFAGTARAQGKGATTDSARLQGVWKMVSGSADGMSLPPDYVKGMSRAAEGPYVTITLNGSLYFKAHFVLGADKSPKEIDYHMMEGVTKGATQLGVYRISGDTAWFAFASPGKPRATDFTTKAGDGKTLSMWVRGKL